jgi:hypothetical protein
LPLDEMRHTANKLEDKATALEQAAGELRSANEVMRPATERAGKAEATLARADAIKPDFSRIGTDDIVGAGIPLSEVPGAELMDPRSLSSPPSPSGGVDDTNLMDPRLQSSLPGAAADDAFMDPVLASSASEAAIGDYVDPPSLSNPPTMQEAPPDDAFVDPLADLLPRSELPLSQRPGMDMDGDGLTDVPFYDPTQPNIVDNRLLDRDGDGEPDPFNGPASTDVGDFGGRLPEAGLEPDYVDPYIPEPDTGVGGDITEAGATGSYASDSYGDVPADGMSLEYGT